VRLKFFATPAEINFFAAMKDDSSTIRIDTSAYNFYSESDHLNLQPGEWVEVRSIDEISATFDKPRTSKGLGFMFGMEEFCGKKFKVFKKVNTIRLESTGEIRKLKKPAILLEGVFCDGKHYEGCDRSCFYFWREAWLKRINAFLYFLLFDCLNLMLIETIEQLELLY
jgi:hypothetical protein